MTEYLSIRQLSEYAGVSQSTLRRILPERLRIRIGRQIKVRRHDFDRWVMIRHERKQRVHPKAREIYNELIGAA